MFANGSLVRHGAWISTEPWIEYESGSPSSSTKLSTKRYILCFLHWEKFFKNLSNLFLWLSIYNELFKNFVIIGEFPYNFVLQNYTSKDRVYDKFSLRWLVIKYQFRTIGKLVISTRNLSREIASNLINLKPVIFVPSYASYSYPYEYFTIMLRSHRCLQCIFSIEYKRAVLASLLHEQDPDECSLTTNNPVKNTENKTSLTRKYHNRTLPNDNNLPI